MDANLLLLCMALGAPPAPANGPLAPATVTPEPAASGIALPTPEPSEPVAELAPGYEGPRERVAPRDDPTWIDSGRRLANRALYAAVDRFDGFFGDDRMGDMERPRSRIRLRSSFTYGDDGDYGIAFSVKSTLKLPGLNRLLKNARLVVASATADAFADADEDGEEGGGGAPVDPSAPRPRAGAAELRFDVVRGVRFSADVGGGLKFSGIQPVPYGRARVHAKRELGRHLLLRGTQAVAYDLWGQGPYTSTELRLERMETGRLRGLWSGNARWARDRPGFVVNQLAWIGWMVRPTTGVYTGVRWKAFTRPLPVVDSYGYYVGVRANLYRGWIYGQLEPGLIWREGELGPLGRGWLVMFRIDLVFDTRPEFEDTGTGFE